ncbi:MAG: hypothetical protein QM500_03580 [Methylococcales bacterium]
MLMKKRFFNAVVSGNLGSVDDTGIIVELKQFKAFFDDIESDYINSFLPAATIEKGRLDFSHTKYLFRVRKGVYRIHPDAIEEHLELLIADGNSTT